MNRNLSALVFLAACTLSATSLAAAHQPCKSGQKGGTVCAAKTTGKTPVRTEAKTTLRGKAASRAQAHGKATVRGKRAKAGARIASGAAVIATTPLASVLPQSIATVDCDSTQILSQGGSARCPAPVVPKGSDPASQPEVNPGMACFAALAASHAARHLASRVPFLSASAASPEALENRTVPNKMEKEELGSVMAGYSMCLDMGESWRRQAYAPAVLNALNAYWYTAQSILKELAVGKRNFGEAARAIADNDVAYKARIGTLAAELQPTATIQVPHTAQ